MSASNTEVRHLLGRLGDSERQLQLALDAAHLAIWQWNGLTRTLTWSDRFRAMLGLHAERPVTIDAFVRLIHPEDRARLNHVVSTALENAEAFSIEYRIHRPDGEVRWLYCVGHAQATGPGHSALSLAGIVRDVTDTHRAAESAQRHQRYLDQLLHIAPTGVAKFDRQLQFMAVNPRFKAALRIGDCEPVGRSLQQVLPDVPSRLQELLRGSLNGTPVALERVPYPRADGSYDQIDGQIVPWYDERGEVGGTTIILGAVTAQNPRACPDDVPPRPVADSVPTGLVVSTERGAILYANRAWLALAELSEEQALQTTLADLIHPEDRSEVLAAWRQLSVGGRAEREFRLLRTTRGPCWVHCRTARLHDRENAGTDLIHSCEDLSARLEERAVVDRLQLQVRSLTQRLQQLRRSEREEIATRLQGELAVRLRAFQAQAAQALAAQLPAATLGGGDAPSLAAHAAAALDALDGMVLELNPGRLEDLGFEELLTRYVGDFADRHALEFELELPDTPLPLGSRALRVLYTVAEEALSNVQRHARATRVDLAVRVAEGQVQLRVRDNGVGIRDAERLKPGTFGLRAAAESLAEIGGTLRVTGGPAQGTSVDANVPLTRGARSHLRLCD